MHGFLPDSCLQLPGNDWQTGSVQGMTHPRLSSPIPPFPQHPQRTHAKALAPWGLPKAAGTPADTALRGSPGLQPRAACSKATYQTCRGRSSKSSPGERRNHFLPVSKGTPWTLGSSSSWPCTAGGDTSTRRKLRASNGRAMLP